MNSQNEITYWLIAWNEGDERALGNLIPLVERELQRIAAAFMRRENPRHTLQTDALVNEAYLRLVDQRRVDWHNRAHFFALAANIMRRILLDHAKSKRRQKRGGGCVDIDLEETLALSNELDLDSLICLDYALKKLEEIAPVKSRVVELRHFGGLSVEETADVLGIAPVTVTRHWNFAKAFLRREMGDGSDEPGTE
jgi:RNA polymerase sigma factor (TIGR02999 family)